MPAFPFDNSYATLPDRFYTRLAPTPVAEPELIAVNEDLAARLGITLGDDREVLAQIFAGNEVPEGAAPLAQVYAGHQFGGWSPQLGDGRAVMLGEVVAPDGARFDVQLKGAGPTPYSRNGDGRAWLGPVLREYIVSEAMAAYGIPTTRALAAVSTGETVLRERAYPGAVLTRVASSHIRVGTFQFFAARIDVEALQALLDHTIARHYPGAEGPLGLLNGVMQAQAELVARWMGLGFIHGVMNTDNMALSGETIDYGPCAFMDTYEAMKVFSSIDQFGRYAYAQQPQIAAWNIAQLATALLPLMPDREAAIETFTEAVNGFAARFDAAWQGVLSAKLGLEGAREENAALAFDLLARMEQGGADFTRSFRALSGPEPERAAEAWAAPGPLAAWLETWRARLAEEGVSEAERMARMQAVNPALIPRNHRVEEAIQAAVGGDYAPFHRLNAALRDPFNDRPEIADLQAAPAPSEAVTRTFCGT
ncbi:protein adenylyltransferase SelO [Gymnodinialimonas ceratoperidinii]|uniref:Protein nucleotidyltransferase YdiU n=1 Tax=Gymnodinialimonas ceratoperidinii TaxID=2856823 RepID=A0A8F6TVP6_9RHOB|nr:YdiU family protein [Gymnodinialimonas ceratoperidinii]QXT38774.1 YdiU family protein [Gymnodinialimonas ceratoperidinii]